MGARHSRIHGAHKRGVITHHAEASAEGGDKRWADRPQGEREDDRADELDRKQREDLFSEPDLDVDRHVRDGEGVEVAERVSAAAAEEG